MEYKKYLIKIPVSGEICALLCRERSVRKPSSGFHITVALFSMYEDVEKQLADVLMNMHVPHSFSLRVTGRDTFGDNNHPVQVLLTSLPAELRQLHEKVVVALHSIGGVSPDLRETEKKYYGCWYTPHISFSKSKEFVRFHHEYRGMTFPVTSFDFMKEREGGWEKIRSYPLL